MHKLEKAAGILPAVSMILGACGLIEPEPIPSAEFGPLLGADASLWEPLPVAGEPDSYVYLLFGSTGESGDSLVVEEFDLNAGRIRGSFQFGARSAGGGNILRARGRFYGRVESQPGRCSLDIGP